MYKWLRNLLKECNKGKKVNKSELFCMIAATPL